MKCPGCKTEVTLPHECRHSDGKRFKLVDPRDQAASIDDMNDDGPQFSSGPDNYDPNKAVSRFGDPHESDEDDGL